MENAVESTLADRTGDSSGGLWRSRSFGRSPESAKSSRPVPALDDMSKLTYTSIVWITPTGRSSGCMARSRPPPFSAAARIEAGVLLRRLQRGETLPMPHSRPMPVIGPRCHELRINDTDGTWRIIYRLDHDAVIIGEVFRKKTPATPGPVIDTCKRRFEAYDR